MPSRWPKHISKPRCRKVKTFEAGDFFLACPAATAPIAAFMEGVSHLNTHSVNIGWPQTRQHDLYQITCCSCLLLAKIMLQPCEKFHGAVPPTWYFDAAVEKLPWHAATACCGPWHVGRTSPRASVEVEAWIKFHFPCHKHVILDIRNSIVSSRKYFFVTVHIS